MDSKIPKDLIEELDINAKKSEDKRFEVTAIVESHQIKLPIPKKLMKIYDLEFTKGEKLELKFDRKKKELKYKIKNG